MPIELICIQCSTLISANEEFAGKQVRCPNCEAVSIVPASSSPSANGESPYREAHNPYATPHQDTVIYQQSAEFDLAERGSRLVAAIVDGVATIGPLLVLVLIGAAIAATLDNEAGAAIVGICAISGVFILFAVSIYNMVITATHGETIGKRLQGIRVVKETDGAAPGFVHGVLLRSWVMVLLSQVPFVGLIDVLMIFGDKRQCLHDLIASTRVVNGRYRTAVA